MFLGVFQQQAVEISAKLLKPRLDRCQLATVDDYLWTMIDRQRCGHRSKFFLNCVPLTGDIAKFEFQLSHSPTSLFQPIAIIVAPRGVWCPVPNNSRIFFSQIGPSLLGGAQLISIRGDFVV